MFLCSYDKLSDHLRVFQHISNGLFLFRCTLRLIGSFRLGLIVALPLGDPTLLLDLGDVEGSDVQAGLLLDIVLDLLVGGFALRSSQIQLIQSQLRLPLNYVALHGVWTTRSLPRALSRIPRAVLLLPAHSQEPEN